MIPLSSPAPCELPVERTRSYSLAAELLALMVEPVEDDE